MRMAAGAAVGLLAAAQAIAGIDLGADCLRARPVPGLSCSRSGREAFALTPRLPTDGWRVVASAGQSGLMRFVPTGERRGREPLFAREGVGAARTAEEWVTVERGVLFFEPMADGSLTPPIRIRRSHGTRGLEGLLIFHSEEVRLTARPRDGRRLQAPSEPFWDLGIDLDGDGIVCGAEEGSGDPPCCPQRPSTPLEVTRCNELRTTRNGTWDVELDVGCDATVTPCDAESAGEHWPPAHAAWSTFVAEHAAGPHAGDPRLLRRFAHEPFVDVAKRDRGDALASVPVRPGGIAAAIARTRGTASTVSSGTRGASCWAGASCWRAGRWRDAGSSSAAARRS